MRIGESHPSRTGGYRQPPQDLAVDFVQVMYRNPPSTASAGRVQYSQGGYEASFGRYEINERARSFNYHVKGALVRNPLYAEWYRVTVTDADRS